ncbi:gamma-aminobutyric acid type B receptor subunit 2-like isoform X2 [Hydractinia symbiolongicarpus]|uniref:gamma-aminobutyric acid type B receptor subunit 2-like isoform X2 n=1 Tax=Hydractinia symbiolongicarpus TaxID=13093 RepID=UPI00254F76D7|nr:gamma-aminobutyric acid type B receptor subunit 2-like isoform X2 [Hydractinia symbiolongicarpus]
MELLCTSIIIHMLIQWITVVQLQVINVTNMVAVGNMSTVLKNREQQSISFNLTPSILSNTVAGVAGATPFVNKSLPKRTSLYRHSETSLSISILNPSLLHMKVVKTVTVMNFNKNLSKTALKTYDISVTSAGSTLMKKTEMPAWLSTTTSNTSKNPTTTATTTTKSTARKIATTKQLTTKKIIKAPLKAKLSLKAFFKHKSDGWTDRHNTLSALTVAKDLINNHSNILAGYELDIMPVQENDEFGYIVKQMMTELMVQEKKSVAVLGPTSSEQMKAFRDVVDQYDLSVLQMNFAATDPLFSSKKLHPGVFSLVPSFESLNTAIVHFLKKFNIKRVGILFTTEFEYSSSDSEVKVVKHLNQVFKENNIEIVREISYQSKYISRNEFFLSNKSKMVLSQKLQEFKNEDIRIIVGVFREHNLKDVMCEAYKHNMTGSKYLWIISNYNLDIKFHERKDTECTAAELSEASKNILFPRRVAKRLDYNTTIAEITGDEVWELIKEKRRTIEKKTVLEYNDRSLYAYDTVWAVALALDRVIKKYNYTEKSFSYDRMDISKNLIKEMEKVSYQGASGFIRFGQNQRGRTVDYTKFEIYGINGTFTHVGTYDVARDDIDYNLSYQKQLFSKDYRIPVDGIRTTQSPEKFTTTTVVLLWTFAVLATCLSLFFLAFNVSYRKELLIKMSSPNINNLIVAGCILCYLAVVLYGLDAEMINMNRIPMVCDAVVFCLTFGFTLAFGALFSKTWRIYRIFTSARTLQVIVIKDFHLFGVIFFMLCLDSVILTIWMLTSPYELKIETVNFQVHADVDQIDETVIYRCSCELQLQFGVALFLYKGILLIFGLFLAWETRNIKVTAINDSKNIGLAVYNVGVLASIGSICSLALYQTTFYTELYVVFALCILFCTTLTVMLVFLPKISLIKNGSFKTILLSKTY